MTSMTEEILAQIPADELAAQLGTDPETAMEAARRALPALLGGLSGNVSTGGGDALGAALLRDHDGSLLDLSDPLSAVDADDGAKIIGHIFGDQQERVVETLGATTRGGSSLFSKLLPILAPLVMAWLAKRVIGSITGSGGGGAASSTQSSGGGLGGLLGGLFGGGSGGQSTPAPAPTPQQQSGGGLGGLLGGLFGGGGGQGQSAPAPLPTTQEQSGGLGGGLGGLLGGLLGREVEAERSSAPDFAELLDLLGGEEAASDSQRGDSVD